MNIEYKESVKEARAATLKGVSSLVIERLTHEPGFRTQFQRDPVAALKDCGCPDNMLPDQSSVTSLDLIDLGRKLERVEIKGMESIAVACVVI